MAIERCTSAAYHAFWLQFQNGTLRGLGWQTTQENNT